MNGNERDMKGKSHEHEGKWKESDMNKKGKWKENERNMEGTWKKINRTWKLSWKAQHTTRQQLLPKRKAKQRQKLLTLAKLFHCELWIVSSCNLSECSCLVQPGFDLRSVKHVCDIALLWVLHDCNSCCMRLPAPLSESWAWALGVLVLEHHLFWEHVQLTLFFGFLWGI